MFSLVRRGLTPRGWTPKGTECKEETVKPPSVSPRSCNLKIGVSDVQMEEPSEAWTRDTASSSSAPLPTHRDNSSFSSKGTAPSTPGRSTPPVPAGVSASTQTTRDLDMEAQMKRLQAELEKMKSDYTALASLYTEREKVVEVQRELIIKLQEQNNSETIRPLGACIHCNVAETENGEEEEKEEEEEEQAVVRSVQKRMQKEEEEDEEEQMASAPSCLTARSRMSRRRSSRLSLQQSGSRSGLRFMSIDVFASRFEFADDGEDDPEEVDEKDMHVGSSQTPTEEEDSEEANFGKRVDSFVANSETSSPGSRNHSFAMAKTFVWTPRNQPSKNRHDCTIPQLVLTSPKNAPPRYTKAPGNFSRRS